MRKKIRISIIQYTYFVLSFFKQIDIAECVKEILYRIFFVVKIILIQCNALSFLIFSFFFLLEIGFAFLKFYPICVGHASFQRNVKIL